MLGRSDRRWRSCGSTPGTRCVSLPGIPRRCISALIKQLGSRASAGTAKDAATFGDVIMLTVPLAAIPGLASTIWPRSSSGKVVLDTGNAYEQRDGEAAREATKHPQGSAGWAAAKFPDAHWVKAFNTVYFKVLEREAHREGDRVGIPLADDPEALETAAQLVREAGFDPVIVGPLARGKAFEPGTRPDNTRHERAGPAGTLAVIESTRSVSTLR